MEKILQWSIAQQSGDKDAIERVGTPDPKLLQQVFGNGPDEPTLMKQSIQVVQNKEASQEDKLTALDNFEMLIENLDNANNIENLKLWPSIIEILDDEDVELQVLAASIIGVAVQNNPNSQEAFAKYPEGVRKLVGITTSTQAAPQLVLKSLFSIASYIRNFEPGYDAFASNNGWEIVSQFKGNDNLKIQLRLLSLVSAIFSTDISNKVQYIHKYNLIEYLTDILSLDSNVTCIDKSLNIINHLHLAGFTFNEAELIQLQQGLDKIEPVAEELQQEDLNAVKKLV